MARDYNDHLQAEKMGNVMVLNGTLPEATGNGNDSMEANGKGVPWKYSDLFLYKSYNRARGMFEYVKVAREDLQTGKSWQLEH